MSEVHYGVVQQAGRWRIIGDNLKFGAYPERQAAVEAARRLANKSLGQTVQLHVQQETGELSPPEVLGGEGEA
ncbi:MAG: hypothetical protein JWP49_1751 [Phenylobacterium sp.]|jgi:hypothetical protein|nr:hypothetical protein [Phenylobacterium sp.]